MSIKTIPDGELTEAFTGTNFGGADHRALLEASVLKKALGYHCGHTITTIMRDMRLIGKNGNVLRRGQLLLREAYDHLLRAGG